MKIPPEDFRWYAAFHDEGNHPHVHMMAWSAKPNQAYLSVEGIKKIKSTLTNQIFRQELLHVYEQKSKSRDELVAEKRKAMLELAKTMRETTCIHPEAEQMIWDLSRQLSQVGGKKTYGYLPKPMKKLVDEIVDQMARLLLWMRATRHGGNCNVRWRITTPRGRNGCVRRCLSKRSSGKSRTPSSRKRSISV